MRDDYPHEDDRYEVPEKYLKMSLEELEREEAKELAKMKANPQTREPRARFVNNGQYLFEIL